MQDTIQLRGLRENNLKGVNIAIPKRKITVFTGVSGSGKSSVVFDTMAQEAGRQLNETYPNFVRLFLPRYRRPKADLIEGLPAAIVVDQSRLGGNARSTLGTATDINSLLRVLFSRFGQPRAGYGNAYSFNDPEGMCPTCEGIGRVLALDEGKALDMNKSLNEGALLLPGFNVGSVQWSGYAASGFFDADKKLRDYTPEEMHQLLHAQPQTLKSSYLGTEINTTYEGLALKFVRQNTTQKERTQKSQQRVEAFAKTGTCPDCGGKRLNQKALDSKILGLNIHDFTSMQPAALIETLQKIPGEAAAPVVHSLVGRLQMLIDIGLDYMALTRETGSLSGGESQRVKMAKHLASGLADLLYIFDEPSIGLHPRDVHRLNELLCRLRDKGNTVVVVEHDPAVMAIADHVVDMGPRAGRGGGQVVYSGPYSGLLGAATPTGECLRKGQPLKETPRTPKGFVHSESSSLHNLKDAALHVPLGVFTVITGVAGSGKSTLVNNVFAAAQPEAIHIDQSPVSTNIRSNPATYSGILDGIRKLFAAENGVQPGLFSYNSAGACPTCKGIGHVEINLSFMDKAEVQCTTCCGTRFDPAVLEYHYKGHSIVDIMDATVDEAMEIFETADIQKKLGALSEVGLGYLRLGQPLTTLSGGELQRLKLAGQLHKKGNLYILDEPTTGLHMSDFARLLHIIDRLVDGGNTVLAIEHNMDVVKRADWVIDLGPEGGAGGGHILYEGALPGLLQHKTSHTAAYLRKEL